MEVNQKTLESVCIDMELKTRDLVKGLEYFYFHFLIRKFRNQNRTHLSSTDKSNNNSVSEFEPARVEIRASSTTT